MSLVYDREYVFLEQEYVVYVCMYLCMYVCVCMYVCACACVCIMFAVVYYVCVCVQGGVCVGDVVVVPAQWTSLWRANQCPPQAALPSSSPWTVGRRAHTESGRGPSPIDQGVFVCKCVYVCVSVCMCV